VAISDRANKKERVVGRKSFFPLSNEKTGEGARMAGPCVSAGITNSTASLGVSKKERAFGKKRARSLFTNGSFFTSKKDSEFGKNIPPPP
jgi:hypothetical protein